MAKQIDLADGGSVTRAWAGDGFRFEIHGRDQHDNDDFVIIRPTRVELLKIASLFRQAAFKLPKPEGREHIPDTYEAPTVTSAGELDEDEREEMGEGVEDPMDGRDDE